MFRFTGKYFYVGLIVVTSIVIYSYKKRTSLMEHSNKVVFSLPSNQIYKFHIRETAEVDNTIESQPPNGYTYTTDLNLLYTTGESNGGNPFNIKVLFSKPSVVNVINGKRDTTVVNPYLEGINALDGAAFTITLTPGGEVAAISGYEDYKKKFMALYAAAATEKDGLATTTLFEESLFKDIFNAISYSLQGRSIEVNATWEKMEGEDLGGAGYIKTVYTCDRIQNGIVYISSSAPVVKELKRHDANMLYNGTIRGNYELEANTGILINGKRVIDMSRVHQLGGIDRVIKVRKTISITGQRVTE